MGLTRLRICIKVHQLAHLFIFKSRAKVKANQFDNSPFKEKMDILVYNIYKVNCKFPIWDKVTPQALLRTSNGHDDLV